MEAQYKYYRRGTLTEHAGHRLHGSGLFVITFPLSIFITLLFASSFFHPHVQYNTTWVDTYNMGFPTRVGEYLFIQEDIHPTLAQHLQDHEPLYPYYPTLGANPMYRHLTSMLHIICRCWGEESQETGVVSRKYAIKWCKPLGYTYQDMEYLV